MPDIHESQAAWDRWSERELYSCRYCGNLSDRPGLCDRCEEIAAGEDEMSEENLITPLNWLPKGAAPCVADDVNRQPIERGRVILRLHDGESEFEVMGFRLPQAGEWVLTETPAIGYCRDIVLSHPCFILRPISGPAARIEEANVQPA